MQELLGMLLYKQTLILNIFNLNEFKDLYFIIKILSIVYVVFVLLINVFFFLGKNIFLKNIWRIEIFDITFAPVL